ncbi:hypothetical protein ACVWVY_000418 [Bradyrhizobium sp. URHC0002]
MFLACYIPSLSRNVGDKMPVIILWAVPAIIAVGGGIYLISHMH